MLNPSFSKEYSTAVTSPYVAPDSIVNRTIHGNEAFDTGTEYRLQPAFGEELWLKLERAGLTPDVLSELSVLEVCAGTGFLTFHLLSRCSPKSLTVNDISVSEMTAAQHLMQAHYPAAKIDWVLGDMHTVTFERKFDLIIGNSFIHHFYNVPQVLSRFHDLLNPGGLFITLHEPTPMSTVVEGAKMLAWPLAVLAPGLVNNIARARYKGEPSATDLWMFEPALLKQVALQSGFKSVDVHSWGLLRPIVVQQRGLHLSETKPALSADEVRRFRRAIRADALLNRMLPQRCFGSICLLCRR
ncbi:MAG: class I SAM-dependent methyltransferase [Burkholderiaceae bacterium]|nr:class I SAM-dependent methyltransferase [Burkholderiaceae bacterium]